MGEPPSQSPGQPPTAGVDDATGTGAGASESEQSERKAPGRGAARRPAGARPMRRPPTAGWLRRWMRRLRLPAAVVVAILVAIAVGIGLAFLVQGIRGDDTHPSTSGPPPSVPPVTSSVSPSPTVPADWVAESEPPPGLAFRHPPGWHRQTSGTLVLRVDPSGARAVGAGPVPGTDPHTVVTNEAKRLYGAQAGYQLVSVTDSGSGPQAHTTAVVHYRRNNVATEAVLDGYQLGRGLVLVVGRAPAADAGAARALVTSLEASLTTR